MKIGTLHIEPPLALAPMAGVTDAAFRAVCREQGAALTCSEMISSRALVYQDKKTKALLTRGADESPFAVQLFGNDPAVCAEAAQRALALTDASLIDINMGCPTPKITSNGDGCALMRKPQLAASIIRAVRDSVSVPVTVKFRKGWDGGNVNAVDFARIAEDAGAAAITVHGRTRVAMYSGRADWDIIRAVKRAVKIPVFANGDIFTPESCIKALKYTGADGAMIGRSAFGNPWIFAQCAAAIRGEEIPKLPPLSVRLATAERQLLMAAADKGEHVAVLEARRHLSWYLRGVRGGAELRARLMSITELTELLHLIRLIAASYE